MDEDWAAWGTEYHEYNIQENARKTMKKPGVSRHILIIRAHYGGDVPRTGREGNEKRAGYERQGETGCGSLRHRMTRCGGWKVLRQRRDDSFSLVLCTERQCST